MLKKTEVIRTIRYAIYSAAALAFAVGISSCDGDDPAPVNEEEVITTLNVTLATNGGGTPVTLRFFDADGDGSGAPVKTVSGNLAANKTYTGVITLSDDSKSTPVDITEEVAEEADDHLFCFTVTGSNLTVTAVDKDSKNLPIGLASSWLTTSAGNATVKIVLRHQPGTKTGQCPGTGDTDVEVDFNVTVQ
ncbi:MAG TPA: hypothetical protein VGD40_03160 [Chryseosolibacter sp.]